MCYFMQQELVEHVWEHFKKDIAYKVFFPVDYLGGFCRLNFISVVLAVQNLDKLRSMYPVCHVDVDVLLKSPLSEPC